MSDSLDEEVLLIETKRGLAKMLRKARTSSRVTQAELAEMISSSQSRVAKMEVASPDVSLDLILRALFALGLSHLRVGKFISGISSSL